MGLLDSNKFNFKNSSYVGTVANVSANSYISGFNQVDVQSANSVAIVISGVTETNCMIYVNGSVETSGYSSLFLYGPDGRKQEYISKNGVYYVDVTSVNYIGLQSYVSIATITIKIKASSNSNFIGQLMPANVIVDRASYSINKTGEVFSILNPGKSWLCLNIKLDTPSSGCDLTVVSKDNYFVWPQNYQYIYDNAGNILDKITNAGTYYVYIGHLVAFKLHSITAIDNNATISYSLVNEEPSAIKLKPIQVVYKETKTLSAGASSSIFNITDDRFFAGKNLFKFFKFYYIYIRYTGVNSAYKTVPLTISTANIVEGTMFEPAVVRAKDTSYMLNTEDWVPITCGQNGMRVTIGLADGTSTIEAGDTLYFEIRGLR